MKTLFIIIGIFTFLLLKDLGKVSAATLKCYHDQTTVNLADYKAKSDNSSVEYDVTNNHSEPTKHSLNKLFQNIQCTLEKAKPWVAELQKEAKRLEEAAKVLGLGIINSFGDFVDRLVEETAETSTSKQNNFTISEGNAANSTEVVNAEISQYLCPEGFAADHDGICERID